MNKLIWHITQPHGGVCGLMVAIIEMNMLTSVQILNKAINISYSANTFRKGMNPTIFPPSMGK